ncbi:MAG: hypothetical protein EZS28_010116 [Streblomastix strix]|uniref:Uncharacterized protein n=1 Tax=Streblomastix strix TaxID=222440 RepID=A0A5J4WJ19_9EUKA|nr:MAG: hypothetical protein EZS28_010116 [Streblomastix strix]
MRARCKWLQDRPDRKLRNVHVWLTAEPAEPTDLSSLEQTSAYINESKSLSAAEETTLGALDLDNRMESPTMQITDTYLIILSVGQIQSDQKIRKLMDKVQQFMLQTTQRNFVTSFDLHQVLHHIRVSKELQPYLRFRFERIDCIYQGMPFEVATAPQIFAQPLKPAIIEVR